MKAATPTKAVVLALPTAAPAPVKQQAGRSADEVLSDVVRLLRAVPRQNLESIAAEWAALLHTPESSYLQGSILRRLQPHKLGPRNDGAVAADLAQCVDVFVEALGKPEERFELVAVLHFIVDHDADAYRQRLLELLAPAVARGRFVPAVPLAKALPVVLNAMALVPDRERLKNGLTLLAAGDFPGGRRAFLRMLQAAKAPREVQP